jgi:hypothetical protein
MDLMVICCLFHDENIEIGDMLLSVFLKSYIWSFILTHRNVTTSGKTCYQRYDFRRSFCLGVDHPTYIVNTPNKHKLFIITNKIIQMRTYRFADCNIE